MNIIRSLKNNLHKSQAINANKKYGYPNKKLKIIGVTGTDGKTTTVSLIYHILKAAKLKVGFISSVEAKIGDKSLDTGLHVTSPDPWILPKYLKMMVDQDIEYAILETTSQGLDQHRFEGIKFDAAVITNIREDHLDYHTNWEKYAAAKFTLLRNLKEESIAVLNADDEKSAQWLRKKSADLKQNIYVKWSSRKSVVGIKLSLNYIAFQYNSVEFMIPIPGMEYNLDNILEAILLCESLLPLSEIKKALESFKMPKGRMEVVLEEPLEIIVDFAHTAPALSYSLPSLAKLLPKGKKLTTVFGCAGKRDKGRRRMGKSAAKYSDLIILTAEDPRSEKVAAINTEIYNYAKQENGILIQRFRNHDDYVLTSLGEIHAKIAHAWKNNQKPVICFDEDNKNSRRDAIELAIRLARRGDFLYITGKGHEQSLAFGNNEKEYAWNDPTEITEALARLNILNN